MDTGIWALPGGAVEPDEDPAAAVTREAREELGIVASLQGLIGVYGGPEFRVSYPNGDLVSYVAIVYPCRAAGTPTALDTSEVPEVRFVAHLDDLPTGRWLPSVQRTQCGGGKSAPLAVPRADVPNDEHELAQITAGLGARIRSSVVRNRRRCADTVDQGRPV